MKKVETDRYCAEIIHRKRRGRYPKCIRKAYLERDDFDAKVSEIHEAVCELMGSDDFDPDTPLVGLGPALLIGYDCEWWDRSPKGMRRPLCCLSYQMHVIGVGGEMSVIFFPKSGAVEDRLSMAEMVDFVVRESRACGLILETPSAIIMAGYFLRADLAMASDLASFKNQLSNVGGKLASANKMVDLSAGYYLRREIESIDRTRPCFFREDWITRTAPIFFIDMAKHVPEKTPLAAVGDLLKLPKLTLPPGHSISRMDRLLADNPKCFRKYALRDAEIAVRFYIEVLKFARKHIFEAEEMCSPFIPVSAGAMAVKLSKKLIKAEGSDPADLFGFEYQTRVERNFKTGGIRKVKKKVLKLFREYREPLAVMCYHGGRNETYAVGPLLIGVWHDFDLVGAYTTGLVLLRQIDFERCYETRDVNEFLQGAMGFAHVNFKFPPSVRFPCLPVKVEEQGLKFPLEGESFCTAPEIALALQLGATIHINIGVIFPMRTDGNPIFQSFVKLIRALRDEYQGEALKLFNEYAKLLGNSLYGKTAQGLKGHTAFDTETEESHKISMSDISCGPMAAHVTGFVRAVLGEILNKIPAHRTVVSCTTDGFLTDADPTELDFSGELCQRYWDLCRLVEGEDALMLKEKHQIGQPLSMKTRACSTLVEGDPADKGVKKIVLAKGSISPPEDCKDHVAYINALYMNRFPGQKTMMRPFVSVSDQYLLDIDVFRVAREVTMNLEYDMKRRPVNPRMVDTRYGAHIAFDSEPWAMVEQADMARAFFDGWREKHCLKTLEDWDHWWDYYETGIGLRKVRKVGSGAKMNMTDEGGMGVLRRTLLRAFRRSMWGMDNEAFSYPELAARLTALGLETSVDDVKNAKRKNTDPAPHSVPRLPELVAIIERFKEDFPDLDAEMLWAEAV